MNICIFDTETTSLEKPFCYNIGYIITDTETNEIKEKREFICQQVWHNPMLFTTAYYADKRGFYIKEMRQRNIKLMKFGYICQQMIRDFKAYNIKFAFAYNSSFDEKVFEFNCDWFKCNNPFDTVEIKDIRAFAHKYIVDDDYKKFCEKYELFSESLHYSTTAENVYKYVSQNINFIEAHTALNDAIIENEILKFCFMKGGTIFEELKAKRSIERKVKQKWKITNGKKSKYFYATKVIVYKTKQVIKIQES